MSRPRHPLPTGAAGPSPPARGASGTPSGYLRTALEGVGPTPVRAAEGSTETEVGVADGLRVGADERAGPRGVGTVLGAEVDGVRPVGSLALGRGLSFRCEGAGSGTVDGLLAGGGASGTAGEAGPSDCAARSGSATSTATAQASPAPSDARSSRRRAAPLRMASYRPAGGPSRSEGVAG